MGGVHIAACVPKSFFTGIVDPSSISNLDAWFKASDFDAIADTTEIATWSDQTSNHRDLTAKGGAGDRVKVSRNSINTSMTSVENSGGHQGLESGSWIPSNKDIWSIFAVVWYVSASNESMCAFDDGNAAGMRSGLNTGKFDVTYPNVADYPANEAVSTGAWHKVILVSNGSSTLTVYVDGVALTWPTQPVALNNTPAKFQLFQANAHFDGKIAEWALYNKALTSGNRATLNAYALSRFGV